jgi:hypothetical protein
VSATTRTDQVTVSHEAPVTDAPVPSPAENEGRLVRAQARPGLTGTGVAVLVTAVGLVASILSELITGGLGLVFAIPFVLVSAYCAAEVSLQSMRSAVVVPPLVAFLVALTSPIWGGDTAGLRGWLVKTLTSLATMAPTLLLATGAAAAIVGWRYWRTRRS